MVTSSPGPRFGAIAAIVLALLLPTSAARADKNTAAIVISGKVDQGTFNLVEVAIAQYLQAQGWSIKAGGSDAVDATAVASCVAGDKTACVMELLAPLGVERVVLATAKSEKAKDGEETVAVMAWILATRDGSVIVSNRRYCERCTPDLLESTTVDLMSDLLRDMRAKEGHSAIRIRSTPPGAVITLDDERVGVTDMEFGVIPGPHRVSVQKDGYRPAARDVTTRAGEKVNVEFALESASDSTRSHRSGGALKWVVGVTGVAAIAGGIAFLGADGPDVQGDSRGYVRSETTLTGVVLTATGAIALGVSGYLFYRDSRRPSAAPSVAVDRNQVSLQFVGTF
jgi:hypothetical protein